MYHGTESLCAIKETKQVRVGVYRRTESLCAIKEIKEVRVGCKFVYIP